MLFDDRGGIVSYPGNVVAQPELDVDPPRTLPEGMLPEPPKTEAPATGLFEEGSAA
jgi:hypothetical protein